jgi:hypothetical protein
MSAGVAHPSAYERALYAHKSWLPIMIVAVLASVFRFRRDGALLTVDATPWVAVVALIAALPFLLDAAVRRRPDTEGPLAGAAPASTRDRRWAAVWVLAPLVTAGTGIALYVNHRPPELDAFAVELGGGTQRFPFATDMGLAVMWDCVLIVGYGTALWMAVIAARWVFWTPTAAALATFGRYCTVAAVLADLAENLLLVWVWRAGVKVPYVLDVASVAARIKFALLVPAVLVAVLGVIVTFARLGGRGRRDREKEHWAGLQVVTPQPLSMPSDERAPATTSAATEDETGPASEAATDEGDDEFAEDDAAFDGMHGTKRREAAEEALDDTGQPVSDAGVLARQRRWEAAYQVPGVVVDGKASAFCMSGGGIRSACVSLGVLDALRPRVKNVRYMISVSGGSYTNGAIAQLLSAAPQDRLPAGGRAKGTLATAYAPGSVELNHLRRHSSYITSTPYEMVVALGVLFRGLVASLALLFAPAVLLGIGVAWLYHAFPIAVLPHLGSDGVKWSSTNVATAKNVAQGLYVAPQAAWTAVVVTLVAAAAWVWQLTRQARPVEPPQGDEGKLEALRRTVTRSSVEDETRRRVTTHARARALAVFSTQAALFVVLAVVGLPVLLFVATWLATRGAPQVRIGGALGGLLLTYAASLAALLWRKRTTFTGALSKRKSKEPGVKAAVPRGLLQLLLVVLTLGLLYATWLLVFGISASATVTTLNACPGVGQLGSCNPIEPLLIAGGIAVLIAVLGAMLDESSLSLHPFYRQRLASAFATRRVSVDDGPPVARPLSPNEPTHLSKFTGHRRFPRAGEAPLEPIFVFGAAANLNADHRTPPGLNSVSYTFSSQWCGGPEVGWVRTEDLENVVSPRLRRDLTVQSAVAISGAAVSSSMGRNSGWYDLFLAISGVRLGAWLPNPAFLAQMKEARDAEGKVRDWTLPGLPRIRGASFLLREVLSRHSINERLLLVSDGGHYENLGLVEALRRRCTTIYLADGGGDRPPTAQGLVEAIDLAYSELGVVIELDEPLASEPGSAPPLQPAAPFTTLNAGLSRTPVMTGKITYPAASGLPEGQRVGRLFVARSTLWPEMPYSLLSYAVRHPEFPRDSTGDQWFDDGQFSAYLNLGRAMGKELAKTLDIDLREDRLSHRDRYTRSASGHAFGTD